MTRAHPLPTLPPLCYSFLPLPLPSATATPLRLRPCGADCLLLSFAGLFLCICCKWSNYFLFRISLLGFCYAFSFHFFYTYFFYFSAVFFFCFCRFFLFFFLYFCKAFTRTKGFLVIWLRLENAAGKGSLCADERDLRLLSAFPLLLRLLPAFPLLLLLLFGDFAFLFVMLLRWFWRVSAGSFCFKKKAAKGVKECTLKHAYACLCLHSTRICDCICICKCICICVCEAHGRLNPFHGTRHVQCEYGCCGCSSLSLSLSLAMPVFPPPSCCICIMHTHYPHRQPPLSLCARSLSFRILIRLVVLARRTVLLYRPLSPSFSLSLLLLLLLSQFLCLTLAT